jgi:aryl-alcohol dehydrogenase-like predicted oxidoreductase
VVMLTYTPDYVEEEPALDMAFKTGKGALIKKALSSGHSKDPGAAIQFALSHKGVSAVITGTLNLTHLQANAAAAHGSS